MKKRPEGPKEVGVGKNALIGPVSSASCLGYHLQTQRSESCGCMTPNAKRVRYNTPAVRRYQQIHMLGKNNKHPDIILPFLAIAANRLHKPVSHLVSYSISHCQSESIPRLCHWPFVKRRRPKDPPQEDALRVAAGRRSASGGRLRGLDFFLFKFFNGCDSIALCLSMILMAVICLSYLKFVPTIKSPDYITSPPHHNTSSSSIVPSHASASRPKPSSCARLSPDHYPFFQVFNTWASHSLSGSLRLSPMVIRSAPTSNLNRCASPNPSRTNSGHSARENS